MEKAGDNLCWKKFHLKTWKKNSRRASHQLQSSQVKRTYFSCFKQQRGLMGSVLGESAQKGLDSSSLSADAFLCSVLDSVSQGAQGWSPRPRPQGLQASCSPLRGESGNLASQSFSPTGPSLTSRRGRRRPSLPTGDSDHLLTESNRSIEKKAPKCSHCLSAGGRMPGSCSLGNSLYVKTRRYLSRLNFLTNHMTHVIPVKFRPNRFQPFLL